MESLLLDPFYIPLVGPRYDVEAKLKTDIEIKLIEITKNKLANELLSLRIEEGNNLLKEDLKFMVPYQAKVASCIYQTSNCALKSRMTGRFNCLLSHPISKAGQGFGITIRRNKKSGHPLYQFFHKLKGN